MYITQCVLALLSLYAGLVHSFSWEIVIGNGSRLEFYDIDGIQTHTENAKSGQIKNSNYDPVHDRVLFADRKNIFSFDIATKTTESLVTITRGLINSFVYDPATELLFWIENVSKINSISLKLGSNNKKHLVLRQNSITHVDVDSCGFIYWIRYLYFQRAHILERARFNGSDREVVIENLKTFYFKIDRQTQKIYWLNINETRINDTATVRRNFINCADLNGKNVRTIYTYPEDSNRTFTISKDFIYWQIRDSFWKFPKNPPRDTDVQPSFFMKHHTGFSWRLAANYNNEDLTRGIRNCEALSNLLPTSTETNVSSNVSLLCVHGMKVSGESRCECTQGYSDERCNVSVCHNYCLHGDCSASAEGQPKCRCYAGYSGDRCEVYACQGYCLNSGVCSLNENYEPVCQCSGYYGGKRCDVPVYLTKMKNSFKSMMRSIPKKEVDHCRERSEVDECVNAFNCCLKNKACSW